MAEWARRIEGEIIDERPAWREHLPVPPADRRHRRHPAVELPVLPHRPQDGAGAVTGNTIVIKPSEETPNNAAKFVELSRADRPAAGRVQRRLRTGRDTGKALARRSAHRHGELHRQRRDRLEDHGGRGREHHQGQSRAGRQGAGDRRWPTPNLDLAVKAIRDSRVINSGQVCNCAERIYVHRKIAPAFVEKFVAAMRGTTYGDPLRRQARRHGAARQRDAGAQGRSRGRQRGQGRGRASSPAASSSSRAGAITSSRRSSPRRRQDMDIMQREIFGPVAPIHVVDSLDEAIEKANDSVYGLTSSIYTNDIASAMRACNELRFGETYINRENFEAMQGFHAGPAPLGHRRRRRQARPLRIHDLAHGVSANMKKLINDPRDYVDEALEGMCLAFPGYRKSGRVIARAAGPGKGKVGVVTGGGFGHLPVFAGYVGDWDAVRVRGRRSVRWTPARRLRPGHPGGGRRRGRGVRARQLRWRPHELRAGLRGLRGRGRQDRHRHRRRRCRERPLRASAPSVAAWRG